MRAPAVQRRKNQPGRTSPRRVPLGGGTLRTAPRCPGSTCGRRPGTRWTSSTGSPARGAAAFWRAGLVGQPYLLDDGRNVAGVLLRRLGVLVVIERRHRAGARLRVRLGPGWPTSLKGGSGALVTRIFRSDGATRALTLDFVEWRRTVNKRRQAAKLIKMQAIVELRSAPPRRAQTTGAWNGI